MSENRLTTFTQRWLLLLAVLLTVAYTLSPFKFSFPSTELAERTRAITALPSLLEMLKLCGHVIWFCFLGGLLTVVYERKLHQFRVGSFAIVAAAFCLTLEVLQFLAESRHARLTDFICNFSGLFLGVEGSLRSRRGQVVGQALVNQIKRRSLLLQKAILVLAAVIWFGVGLYPATGVLQLNWDKDFHLVVGNETDQSRPWLGEIRFLGIYTQALDRQPAELWRLRLNRDWQQVAGLKSKLLVGYDFTSGQTTEVKPMGLLASENLPLEVARDSTWAPDRGGILLGKPSFLFSRGPDLKVTEAIVAEGEFSVVALVRPLHRSQTGPARIVSLSEGIWARNFMLGQENSDLVFRVRNGVNGTNGLQHALWIKDALQDSMHEIVAVYDHGVSAITMDGKQLSPVVDLREPGAYLRLGTGAGGRVVGALLLSLSIALPAVTIAESLGFGRWRHVLAVALTCFVGSVPYAATCLSVGGPWRWDQLQWLAVILLTACPFCYWYVRRQSAHCVQNRPQAAGNSHQL